MHFPNFSILRPRSLLTIRLSPNSGSSHPLVTNATKEVFWALLSSFEHSGVPEDSKPPTFPNVGLHAHTWPKWDCDMCHKALDLDILMFNIQHTYICVWDGWIMCLVPLKGSMMKLSILSFNVCFECYTLICNKNWKWQ